MKKVLVLLVVLLVVLSSSALAETKMDLSSMTMDELIALSNQVASEMDSRNGPSATKFVLPISNYICGKDIRAGRYTITNIGDNNVILRMSDLNNQNGTNAILATGEAITIDLADTWVLKLTTGLAIIEETKMAFAP
jgi:hypothetical protein